MNQWPRAVFLSAAFSNEKLKHMETVLTTITQHRNQNLGFLILIQSRAGGVLKALCKVDVSASRSKYAEGSHSLKLGWMVLQNTYPTFQEFIMVKIRKDCSNNVNQSSSQILSPAIGKPRSWFMSLLVFASFGKQGP